METIGALAKKAMLQHVDNVAARDEGGTLTYGQLKKRACQLAHALMQSGLNKGDRVATLMSNRKEHIEIDAAIAFAGLVKVPVNYRLHPKEATYIIEHAGAGVVIGERQLLAGLSANVERIDVEAAYEPFLQMQSDDFPDVAVGEDDLFAIMYTSGTTGKPKGAMLTHRNMVAGALSLIQACEITYGDTIGHVAPLTHGTNFLAQTAWFYGLKQVVFKKFEPSGFIDELEKQQVTVMFMVPTLVNLMVHDPCFDPVKLRSLKSINMAGAPIAVPKLQKALTALGPKLAETYGLVEAPMAITIMPKQQLGARPSSCGAAGPFAEVKIVAPDGEEAPVGDIGEVACRGSLVMKGYWQNETATAEAIKDGWFYTGDLGRLDDKGYLHLMDRAKDVIITGGLNVYPREVEEVLNQHPAVKETCVFGAPDEKWGERICAHVVLQAGAAPVTEEALIAHCTEHLARYKKPKVIEFVHELPKNSYGKIMRKTLRNQYKKAGV
ncbi:class I adenylate-forming enzyme family protein [Shouchella clausii]|uniref:class I adenylate-forming enzyme family protein n=1 Tax=Shouchella clausii TaxID=79880 RepID=UPI001C733B4B|nr:AMP-binding protein [Shouchella clausii]MBX0319527.1 AMP-binding protein [Shouchella clausii]MCM3310957.1 AMP-binding protein [Psychrobacillus sp. MER TA 17]